MKENDRENNFDLLRVICCVAVISIHVSTVYKEAITDPLTKYSSFNISNPANVMVSLLYNTLSRFAVPCFLMLSGAFLLSKEENANWKEFYRKSMNSIGSTSIIFTILYFLYSELIQFAKIVIRNKPIKILLDPIKALLIGAPYYHMWYLYALIGLYIAIPFIIRFKKLIGDNAFERISWFLFFICVISGYTSKFELNWAISKQVCFLGYLLIGFVIRKKSVKNNKAAILFLLISLILLVCLTSVQYYHSMVLSLSEADEKYTIIGCFNPVISIASILIFTGFSKMEVKKSKTIESLSKHAFVIYLFHAGYLNFQNNLLSFFGLYNWNSIIVIPISIITVFTVSLLLSKVYTVLWDKVNSENRINNWLCKVLNI